MRFLGLMRCALCAVLAVWFMALPAQAEQQGWYVGLSGGIDENPSKATATNPLSPGATSTITTKIGPVVMGSAGYALGNGVRVEGEISWRHNSLDTISGTVGVVGIRP